MVQLSRKSQKMPVDSIDHADNAVQAIHDNFEHGFGNPLHPTTSMPEDGLGSLRTSEIGQEFRPHLPESNLQFLKRISGQPLIAHGKQLEHH